MLCCLLVEKLDILLALLPYTHPIMYPKCIAVGFITLLNQMNFHLSWLYVDMGSIMVSVHMLQIGECAIHIIFVMWLFFMKSIFSCLNIKPDDGFLPNRMPEVFI